MYWFYGAAYLYAEVTVLGCPLWWEVIPFAFIEKDRRKLIAVFDIEIMFSL